MLTLSLLGCWFDDAAYEKRKAELTDHDGDGFAQIDDCDDAVPGVFPGAPERCDGVDEDCDGTLDNGFDDLAEACNGADDDCDGSVDEDPADGQPFYLDADGDGYGASGATISACMLPDGYAATGTDCDDTQAARNPAATEVPYDGVDQDCSGADLDDVDGDGFVASGAGGDDCDDADSAVHPGAEETWERGFTDVDCDGGMPSFDLEFDGGTWVGLTAQADLGYVLGAAADYDGDGKSEILAASLFDSSSYQYGGRVTRISADTGQTLSDAWVIRPSGDFWFLGVAISGLPDVDGDGVPDIAVGSDGYDERRGAAWLVSGAAMAAGDVALPTGAIARIAGETPYNYTGHALASLGDVTADGLDDLGCSTFYADTAGGSAAGIVSIFTTAEVTENRPSDAAITVSGYYDGEQFGVWLSPAGDQNGDGTADYLASSGAGDLTGIVPGGLGTPVIPDDLIARVTGTGDGETGQCRMIGDVDGDGNVDLSCAVGEATLFYTHLAERGLVTTSEATARVTDAGFSAGPPADLGDRDGDGQDETLVTTPSLTTEASWLGIVPGTSLGFGVDIAARSVDLQAHSSEQGGRFGFQSVAVPDFVEVGDASLLLGGPASSVGGSGAGAVTLLPIPR